MKNAILTVCVVASTFLVAGCGGSSNSTPPANNTSANNPSPMVQPEVFAQKKVDVASLTQAVQQYNAAEGHYPSTLQDLVPTYLAKIPATPPGYKLNYDSSSGAVNLVQQ